MCSGIGLFDLLPFFSWTCGYSTRSNLFEGKSQGHCIRTHRSFLAGEALHNGMCDPAYHSTIKTLVESGVLSDQCMKRLAGRSFHMGMVGYMLLYVLSSTARVAKVDLFNELLFSKTDQDFCDEDSD
jgi:hypothetical protein